MSNRIKLVQPWAQLAAIVLVVSVLYLARAVLVPVAFALLLTFTLAPVATFVQRFIGRVASVVVVVVLAFSLLGALGWTFTAQIASLAAELPAYRENIRDKIDDVRLVSRQGSLEKVQEAVKDIQEEIEGSEEDGGTSPTDPVSVVEADAEPEMLGVPMTLRGVLEALARLGLIVVFVVFMLLDRLELRNRLIRLFGTGQMTVTTRALDEAGSRITRYLTRHSLVNGAFGLVVGLGLYFLGVPYPVLWGSLSAVLRFVPYLGPWLSAIAPLLLSLAVLPGWTTAFMVAGLFIAAELLTNIVLETLLYAGAAGVSTVGLLVALAFWTWLWGPLGLLMGTPLTVCFVVLGKYVPSMGFLATLLGDEPVLTPGEIYYQRLLAADHDEAADTLEGALAGAAEPEAILDTVALPALCYARRALESGQITPAEELEMLRSSARIVDDLIGARELGLHSDGLPPAVAPIAVLCCPASGEADALALKFFQQLIDPQAVALEIVSSGLLSSEVLQILGESGAQTVLIVALPPGQLNHTRYLCKRLRAAHPPLRIFVGRWGPEELGGEGAEALLAAGANAVAATLLESRAQVLGTPALAQTASFGHDSGGARDPGA